MANYFDRFDGQAKSENFFDQFDAVRKPVEQQDDGFFRQVADVPLGFTKGLYGGAEMISNLFGADSEVSQNLRGIQGYLNSLMSAQARRDQQEIARIMKDAEDKGVADQVLAGVKAFATAPIDTMTQALGTTAPALIGGLATTLLGAPAAIGIGVGAGIGSMMGAGTVKGTIYEETKQTLLDAGMSQEQAEARAVLAQEFGGKNLDQILAGAALGGIASATGLEKSLIGPVAKRIIGKAAAEDAAAEAVKRGLVSRAGRGAAAEAAPEFAQAAQEQLAANIAAQREGIDVPTMRGVISSGTLEALAGAPLGGLGGALEGGPRAAKPEEEVTTTETPPQEQVIATFPSVGDAGQLVGISVVRTPDGEIIARSPDGEEVNVGNIVDDPNDPAQIQAAVEDTFGAPPPTTELEVVAPPETAPVGAATVEPVTQAAPEPVRPEPPSGPAIPLAEQVRPEEPMRPVPLMAPETIPEEDITGLERRKPVEPPKTVPKTEEEKALDIQRKELEKEKRGLSAPKLQNNLFTVLEGRLNPETVKGYDLTDSRKRQIAAKEGAKMSTLEDLVGDGVLDDFVPENMRVTQAAEMTPMELLDREQAAVDYLRGKLEANNPLTYEAEVRLREIDYTLEQLEQELTLDQINAELEAIAAEERAAGIETITPPAEERGAPSAEGPPAVEAAPEVAPEVAAPPAPVAAPEVTKEAPPETTFPGMPEEPKYQIDKSPEQIYSDLKAYGNLSGVADWAVKNAPNPLAKAIAEKVSARIDELSQAGIPLKFKIVTGSAMNKGNAGYLVLRGGEPGFEMKLQLNGPVTDKTPPGAVSGMTYDTVLHELIHAATTLQINMLGKTDPIVKDLVNLYNQVGQRIRQDRANKVQHPALEKYSRSNMMQNPAEILAWGLTDKDFQDYLKGIQLEKKQTAFSKMVQIVRKMLGLTGEYQTAIESLVEINERLTTEDVGKIRSGLQAINRDLKGLPIGMRRYKMQTGLFEEPKPKKVVAGRSEALAEAAEKRAAREMTAEEYADVIAKQKPVRVPSEVRTPNTKEELIGALTSSQRDKVQPKIANNTPVGLRLDINAGRKGVPAVTIHEKRSSPTSSSPGKVIGYDSVARITDVTFATGNEQIGLKIAKGESKAPLQTMEGRYSKISPEEAVKIAKEAINSKDWIQVQVDPTRHSFFYDRSNGEPVVSAEEVVQIGDQVFAKNVSYGIKEHFLFQSLTGDLFDQAKIVAGRSSDMQQAAQDLIDGKITAADYNVLVNQYKPIKKAEQVRKPNTKQQIFDALKSDQRDRINPRLSDGTRVGTRLDIDSTKKGVPVVAIHEPKPNASSPKQPIVGYGSVAKLANVTFAPGNQKQALKIAAGAYKFPIQTIEGSWVNVDPEQAYAEAQSAINSKDWVQVGVDPTRHAYFYDKSNTEPVVSAEEVIQIGDQVFAKNVEYGIKETYLFSQPGADTSNAARGKVALNVIEELGRAPQPETTKAEWVKSAINDAVENPKVTAENAKARAKKFLDMLETKAFSSDAALNNQIRRSLQDSFKDNPEAMGTLLQISTSQAVHDDALANQFMQMGGLEYDPEVYKYKSVQKKENLKALVEQLVKISDKYGLTQEQAQRVAHTAFEAKRLSSLKQFNDELKLKIDALRKDARNLPTESGRAAARAEIRRQTKNFKYIHMTDGQIAAGLNLFNTIPELTDLVDTWNGMRENAVKELVDSGLWSREGAESMLENVDYVPFYREEQLEKNEGPKEFLRSYLVQAREKKLKGSDKPVNDIFDNMARWTQYAIKRAVRNRQALAMVDAAVDAGIAKEVKSRADGKNVIRVWREGEEVFYDMADPLFMEAFKGLESVAMPGWKFMAKMSNLLRQTVVLYPLFSVSQVPQDSFAAMFTSGLKPRQALKIPFLAVKEFVATIANRSKIHEQLKKYGAVGVRDFSAAIARNDAEIMAGLKGDRKFWGKVKDMLEHISMASDNAVRQAVYSAAKSQGLSEAEAVEKAFQLINFRNKGSSKRIAMAGQVIPFFNAYLAAQHVALKTLSGRGISPQVREDALKTLVVTTASVVTLSILYSMMVGGDDDYEDTPKAIRDRTFMIPGTGLRIPIRTDVFALPKILTENLYMLMTDKGSMDGRKFRDSMGSAVFNAVASPTVVPQAFKPALEVFLNYNFFQQRPLIGTYQKGLETSRQFNDSTSEFAKVLGQTGAISPIAADHLIRGMFGSAGGLFLAVTNPIIDSGTEVKAPSMDLHDMIAALPGTSAFVARPNENALKADFYVLRDEVSKVVNTLNDLKARSPDEIDKFLENEDNINKLGLKKAVNRITQQLSKIRREISRISQATDMSPAEKKAAIQEMRDIEKDMLKDLDIKELRKMANL